MGEAGQADPGDPDARSSLLGRRGVTLIAHPARDGGRATKVDEQRALVVGICDYRATGRRAGAWSSLANARRDAEALGTLLVEELGFALVPGGAPLLDELATREAVRSAIEQSLRASTPRTRWLFYFAGHGWIDRAHAGAAYLVPHGGVSDAPETLLPVAWLKEQCLGDATQAGQILIILDACYAGQALVLDGELTDGLVAEERELGASSVRIRQIVAAGAPGQQVPDSGGEGHSAFTQCLLEALDGSAGVHADGGSLALPDLLGYLKEQVPKRLRLGRSGLDSAAAPRPDDRDDDHLQTVVGGSLAPGSRRQDFTFAATRPRPSPAPARWLQGPDPALRIKALEQIRRECQATPAMAPAASRMLLRHRPRLAVSDRPAPFLRWRRAHRSWLAEPTREVRSQAARTLGAVAAALEVLPRKPHSAPGPTRLGLALLELAIRDPAGAVRAEARRGLARQPGKVRPRLARALLRLARGASWLRRPRVAAAVAALPFARRHGQPTLRAAVPVIRAVLGLASAARWIRATPVRRWSTALVGLLSAGFAVLLLLNYYLSVDGDFVVIRRGNPGFKAVPGVGIVTSGTDFSTADLKDSRRFAQVEPWGFRWPMKSRLPGWLGDLLPHLDDGAACIALWRLASADPALARCAAGIEHGQVQAVAAAAYLALLDQGKPDHAIDLLIAALAGEQRLHDAAATALAAVRDLRAALGNRALARLATRLSDGNGNETTLAQIEAAAILGKGDDVLSREAFLALGRRAEGAAAALAERTRAAQAMAGMLDGKPELAAAALPTACSSVASGPPEVSRALYPALAAQLAAIAPSDRERLGSCVVQAFDAEDPDRQATALAAAGSLTSAAPELAERFLPGIRRSLASRDPTVVHAAVEVASHLRGDAAGRLDVLAALRSALVRGEPPETRAWAITKASQLDLASPGGDVLALLEQGTRDPSSEVRIAAINGLADVALRRSQLRARAVPLLRRALEDPLPWVRQEAAKSEVLFARQIGEDLPRAVAEIASLFEEPGQLGDPYGEARRIGQRLARAAPEDVALVARALTASLGPGGERDHFLLRILLYLGEGSPAALAAVVVPMADLLGGTGGVQSGVEVTFNDWSHLPPTHLELAIDRLTGQIRSGDRQARQAAIEALGDLLWKQPDLARKTAPSLLPLLSDSDAAVRASAADVLSVLGRGAASELALPVLEQCLDAAETSVRLACTRAAAQAISAAPPSPSLVQTLVRSLRDREGTVREAAAAALWKTARHSPLLARPARGVLLDRLDEELDPRVLLAVGQALALLAGEIEPAAGDAEPLPARLLRLAERALVSQDPILKGAALNLLSDLGQTRPALAPECLALAERTLQAGRGDEELPTIAATQAAFQLGLATDGLAHRALQALGRALHYPEPRVRWNAIANGIQPLLRERPALAQAVLVLMRHFLATGSAQGMPTNVAWETYVDAAAILSVDDPEAVRSMLRSRRTGERQAAREALARETVRHLDRLAPTRRWLEDGRPWPAHARLSTRAAVEALELIQRTATGRGPARERWIETLDWLARTGLRDPVGFTLDQMRNDAAFQAGANKAPGAVSIPGEMRR
jgi:Caspase domain/HEAT repeats